MGRVHVTSGFSELMGSACGLNFPEGRRSWVQHVGPCPLLTKYLLRIPGVGAALALLAVFAQSHCTTTTFLLRFFLLS